MTVRWSTTVLPSPSFPVGASVSEAEGGLPELQGRAPGHGEEEEGAAVCPECRLGIQDPSRGENTSYGDTENGTPKHHCNSDVHKLMVMAIDVVLSHP